MLYVHSYIILLIDFSQDGCFTNIDCTGVPTVPATNARECCAGTDGGLAFRDDGTCTVCIGIFYPVQFLEIRCQIMNYFYSSWVC